MFSMIRRARAEEQSCKVIPATIAILSRGIAIAGSISRVLRANYRKQKKSRGKRLSSYMFSGTNRLPRTESGSNAGVTLICVLPDCRQVRDRRGREAQRVMTTCRYSDGTRIVPSTLVLCAAISSRMSVSSDSHFSVSSASNALLSGP